MLAYVFKIELIIHFAVNIISYSFQLSDIDSLVALALVIL
jgi:hypothetical protein